MRTFQINVLIKLLASSTSFEYQEDYLYMQFCMVCFSYNESKTYHTKLHEHTRFETSRRGQEFNQDINMKNAHLLVYVT